MEEDTFLQRCPIERRNIMPVSKKQQACVTRYVKENYDRISLTVPKGVKNAIQEHASQYSESVNAFINRAIEETIERDKSKRQDNT
jgi:predicted HicB family RNase H-like nuclease